MAANSSENMLKCLRDQVHGMVDIHPLCYRLIHLPEFQRLRDIKQLNNLHYIYPGATHDRYQHCIGVYHLAEVFVERLQKVQPELKITEEEKLCVCVAGLLHDLGHITQGHLYPLYVRMCDSKIFVAHEVMSVRIFLYILMKYKLRDTLKAEYNLGDKEIQLIGDIILGSENNAPSDWKWVGAPGREFLLQIIANAKTGVDVDRFDYMVRDCLNLGLNCSYNYDRIIKSARVIKNSADEYEICFDWKANQDVYELFQCRMSLHQRAYSHRSNRIVDIMLIEALRSAEQNGYGIVTKNGVIKLSEACGNIDAYIRATDYLLLQLKNSIKEEYREARELITRVERKDYYPFLGEVIINNKAFVDSAGINFIMKTYDKKKVVSYVTEEFIAEAKKRNLPSPEKYLVVDVVKISMGLGNRNPFRSIHFFDGSDLDRMILKHPSEVSNTMPDQCEDWMVRIYHRGKEEDTGWINELFSIWREKHVKEEDMLESPTIKRRRTFTFPAPRERRFSSVDLMEMQ